MNARVREVVTANGGAIVGEEYFPLDHMDYGATVERIMASGADVVFNTIVPPGVSPFFEQLHESGFTRRGGQLVCTYFDENFLNMVPAAHVEGLYSCLDYYQAVDRPVQPEAARAVRRALSRRRQVHRRQRLLRPLPRAPALGRGRRRRPARSTQADVIAALDHAEIAEGPGGPAAMVPGQHHVRMHMYIAQARDGRFEIVESLGADRSAGARGRDPGPHRLTTPRNTHDTHDERRIHMLLATTQVEDFDRFLEVFSDAGADKRRHHGSKGALVFRDPNEADRVWVIFDWEATLAPPRPLTCRAPNFSPADR